MTSTRYTPTSMNIELTTNCPLSCPQCYCQLIGGKNIDLHKALYWIKEAGRFGLKQVRLSGGETLCYPYIYEVIAAAHKYCGEAVVALSGFNFTQDVYDKLVDAGVTEIHISLNGSTEKINSLTRGGFELSLSALKLLKRNSFPHTWILWVMHSNNAEDFLNILEIAEEHYAEQVTIMAVKPNSDNELTRVPSKEQMLTLRDIIISYRGSVKIGIETCFSPMLALVRDTKLFGNFNIGANKGCMAGTDGFSINVDGKPSPCRHLDCSEDFATLDSYWNNSVILQAIRKIENNKKEPCDSCGYSNYCRHCLAINSKMKGGLFLGNQTCPLYN